MWGTRLHRMFFLKAFRFIPTHVGNTLLNNSVVAPSAVHPHACGEHPKRNIHKSAFAGSSPRMWGTLCANPCLAPCHRFIPTHVGNTKLQSLTLTESAVHPHACGEHSWKYSKICSCTGSSPRMWGTPQDTPINPVVGRFIPTHVGNTH